MPAALPGWLVLLLAHGPLPSPVGLALRLPALLASPTTRPAVVPPAIEAAASFCLLFAAGAALHRSVRSGRGAAEVAHGTARFATAADLRAADLLSGQGVVLGSTSSLLGRRPLTDRSSDHVLVVMPPGGGKTTGPITGSLLNLRGSALVLDPKAELWALSAGWVAQHGLAIRFAPHLGGKTCCWNPLAEIPKGPEEVGLVSLLAENLITYPAHLHGENHWTASARSLLRCLILHVLYTVTTPTFGTVRDLLMSNSSHNDLFDSLATATHDRDGSRGWLDPNGHSSSTHPEVARLARTFRATPDRERGSIVSTLARFLDLWGDPRVRAATSRSDWTLDLLTRPRQPATVYVTVPANRLPTLAPLLRVLITLLSLRVTEGSEDEFRDREALGDHRLHLVLDEFAALGRIPILEEMLAFFRGYGVRSVLAVQDLSQLRRLYGPDHSIAATCRLHVAAASADVATRQEISRRLGEATHTYRKRSTTGSLLTARRTVSRAEVRRPLLTEGEVGTLPSENLLVVKAGHPPVLARRLPYWEHPTLAKRAENKPPDFDRDVQVEKVSGRPSGPAVRES